MGLWALSSLVADKCPGKIFADSEWAFSELVQQYYQNRKFERILPASFVLTLMKSNFYLHGRKIEPRGGESFLHLNPSFIQHGSVFGEAKNGEDFRWK